MRDFVQCICNETARNVFVRKNRERCSKLRSFDRIRFAHMVGRGFGTRDPRNVKIHYSIKICKFALLKFSVLISRTL